MLIRPDAASDLLNPTAVPLPVSLLCSTEDLPGVRTVSFDKAARALAITFDRGAVDAEEMIRRVVQALYQHDARISAVSKGRGLEQRVMELTE